MPKLVAKSLLIWYKYSKYIGSNRHKLYLWRQTEIKFSAVSLNDETID